MHNYIYHRVGRLEDQYVGYIHVARCNALQYLTLTTTVCIDSTINCQELPNTPYPMADWPMSTKLLHFNYHSTCTCMHKIFCLKPLGGRDHCGFEGDQYQSICHKPSCQFLCTAAQSIIFFYFLVGRSRRQSPTIDCRRANTRNNRQ